MFTAMSQEPRGPQIATCSGRIRLDLDFPFPPVLQTSPTGHDKPDKRESQNSAYERDQSAWTCYVEQLPTYRDTD